jgi:hypothetical protein
MFFLVGRRFPAQRSFPLMPAEEERDYDEHEAAETEDCKWSHCAGNQTQDKRGTEHFQAFRWLMPTIIRPA